MPYVKQERRLDLDEFIEDFIRADEKDIVAGDLNYLITRMCLSTHPKNYADYNALIGMLECCKLEMYRRAVGPYEDKKIAENGDVYNG